MLKAVDVADPVIWYPISTLPEHLHSTSLSYAETTLNSRKLVSFPLIAHYLSAGPPLPSHPPSPGDPATPTLNHHSLLQRPGSRMYFWPLSLVMFDSPLRLWNYRCFLLNWLYWHSVFHIWIISYIYICIRSAFYVFLWKRGGGGSELRFSVLLPEQFCVFSGDVVIFGLNSRWSSSFCVFECFL